MSAHGDLVNVILKWLELSPCVCAWQNNTGMAYRKRGNGRYFPIRFGLKGSSDIVGFMRASGRFLAIECKTGAGKVTAVQQDFLDTVTKSGGLAIVARCLEDVQIQITLEKYM